MDYNLTPQLDQLFQVGDRLGQQFDREYWRSHVEQHEFPMSLWRELGNQGHLGTLVAAEHGGAGGGLQELAVLTEGLATAGFPFLALITGPGLAIPVLAHAASPTLSEALVPAVLGGESVVAFAITEPEAGSNILNVATTVEPHAEGVVVNGSKVYTSVADIADHIMVVARTRDTEHDRLGFTVVVVPADAPGLTKTPARVQLNAAESQCNLQFDNVVVPTDHVVGGLAGGLGVLAPALAGERILSGALALGIGQFALNRGVERAKGRELHDGPIGALQGVQHPLAAAATRLAGARHLVRHAAWAADTDAPEALGLAEMACYGATTAGFDATDAALQVLGGSGYTSEGELYSMLGLARLLRSAPVNSEASLSAIGQQVLGLPRSY